MSKQAFVTTIEIQMAVLAETEEEAKKLAFENFRDMVRFPEDFQVGSMDKVYAYPNGWDDDDLLYTNGDEQVTLKEAWNKKGIMT